MILRLLTLALGCASLLALTACGDHTEDTTQPTVGFHAVPPRNRPLAQTSADVGPNGDIIPPEPTPPPTRRVPVTESTTSVPTTAPSGDYPYAVPVKDKPGLVTSPYAPDSGYIDVHGYPPGQEMRDPYTQKIFLVP